MKFLTLLLAILLSATQAVQAQEHDIQKDFQAFNHLDFSVNIGTTGVGFDIAAPFGEYVQFRTGLEFMPNFEHKMHFDIQSFDDQGNILESKLDKLSATMRDLTGYHVDGTIDMIGKPSFWNFKFLVDVFPFRNKHWHFTAGIHWGPSRIAEAYNTTEDAPSLFAVGMYNHLYQIAWNNYNGIDTPLITYGDGEAVYLDPSIEERLRNYGRMGIHVGNYKKDIVDAEGNVIHKKGEPYRMEPNDDSMVKAHAEVNSCKPYLGFGYGGRLFRGDDKYHISFDCGLLFWGGTPNVITHDGTNLSKDVEDINGKVGRYVDLLSSVKAYPVLNLRITRRLF